MSNARLLTALSLIAAVATTASAQTVVGVEVSPALPILSVLSIVAVVGYLLWLFFSRQSRLLLVELVFVVEDGYAAATVIDRMKSRGRRPLLFMELVEAIRASTALFAELHLKEEGFSAHALSIDAADLCEQQSAVVASRGPLGHRHCIVGVIYTLDIVGDIRSGGFAEAKAHLDLLHESRPVEVGSLHAYYGELGEGDDGAEFLEELRRTRIRLHSPMLDAV